MKKKEPFTWNGKRYYIITRKGSQRKVVTRKFSGKGPHIDLENDKLNWVHLDEFDNDGKKFSKECPEVMTVFFGSDVVAFTMGNGSIWPVPLKSGLDIETINSGSSCKVFVNGMLEATHTTNI